MSLEGKLKAIQLPHTTGYSATRQLVRDAIELLEPFGTLHGSPSGDLSVIAALQSVLPWSEIRTCFSEWSWQNNPADVRGHWVRPVTRRERPRGLPSHVLFVPFTTNPDIFREAVARIEHPNVTAFAIDDSPDGVLNPDWVPKEWGIFRPNKFLHFTQVQNLAQRIARELEVDYLVFSHSDSVCADHEVVPDLLKYAREIPSAALVFTHYDVVCSFRMHNLKLVGAWDETFSWYGADADYYRRIRLTGYTVENSPIADRVGHVCSVSVKDPWFKRLSDSHASHVDHYRNKWGGIIETESKMHNTPYNLE